MTALAMQYGDARASFARALAETPTPIGRDAEVVLAQRIEDAEVALFLHQLGCAHGQKPLVSLHNALECGDTRVVKVLRDVDLEDASFEEATVTLAVLRSLDAIRTQRSIEAVRAANLSRGTIRRMTTQSTDQEGARLARTVQRHKNELLRSNLRLVASIARRNEFQNRGLDLLDLVQEGTLGMMSAVDNFDWRRGFKFSTYATWWIRQALQRAIIEHSRTIRIPFNIAELQQKVRRISRETRTRYGREPTEDELATALAVKVDRIRIAMESSRIEPRSLQTPIGEDGELADLVADVTTPRPDEATAAKVRTQFAAEALATLTPREQLIVSERFGLDGPERTLQEIASDLGLTRERIRQIESRALDKLRAVFRRNALTDV